MKQNLHVLLTFDKVHNPLRLPRGSTSEPLKVVRSWSVLNILTSKCALRHNGVHFFDISTSESGPTLRCFVHFDFKRASRHNGVHFFDISTSKSGPKDLQMCFAPQRLALFSTSQLIKVVRSWSVLYILTSNCACVHFFISHLASVSRLSYLFAHLHLLSTDFFSSLICSLLLFSSPTLLFSLPLPISAFHLSILSEV